MEKTINKCITLTQDWSVDFACLKGSPQPGTATFQWNIPQPQRQDKTNRKKLPWYINQTAHQFQPFACRNEAVSAYFQTDRKPDNSQNKGELLRLLFLKETDATVTKDTIMYHILNLPALTKFGVRQSFLSLLSTNKTLLTKFRYHKMKKSPFLYESSWICKSWTIDHLSDDVSNRLSKLPLLYIFFIQFSTVFICLSFRLLERS